jgi:hypothetical protein
MPAIAHHFHRDPRSRSSGDLSSLRSSRRGLMNIGPVTMQAISESTPSKRKAP